MRHPDLPFLRLSTPTRLLRRAGQPLPCGTSPLTPLPRSKKPREGLEPCKNRELSRGKARLGQARPDGITPEGAAGGKTEAWLIPLEKPRETSEEKRKLSFRVSRGGKCMKKGNGDVKE